MFPVQFGANQKIYIFFDILINLGKSVLFMESSSELLGK